MGYNTRFEGTLKFTSEVMTPMLAKLNSMFGEEASKYGAGRQSGYIDLVLAKDFSGIQWETGCEKTYYLVESVNVVIQEMRKEWPQFGLAGSLLAQGEDVEDRWQLYIGEDGFAHKQKLTIPGTKVTCPHCRRSFYAESSETGGDDACQQ